MIKNHKFDLLFFLFLFCLSLLLMINFDLRIVNLHEDDGPIFFALDFAQPQMFAGDYLHGIPVEIIMPFYMATSLLIFLPGLIYKYFNLHPYQITWFLTFLQIFGFGYFLYDFLRTAGISRKMAWLGVVIAYPAAIWGWSFTYFESDFDGIFSAAPRIACFPFILFSFSCLLKKKTRTGYFFLLLAGLIHPPIGLFAIGTIAIWSVLQSGLSNIRNLFPRMIVLFLISLVIAAPAFILRWSLPVHPLPLNEVIQGIKLNIHFYPWNFGLHWPPLQTTCIWLFIAILGYRTVKRSNPVYFNLWIASLFSSVIFGFSQVLGAVLSITSFLDLGGLRAFTIAVFTSMPFVLIFFEEHYSSQGFLFRFLSLLFFLLPFLTVQYGLSWFLAISLALLVIVQTLPRDSIHHIFPLSRSAINILVSCLTGIFILFFILGDSIYLFDLPRILIKIIEFFFGYSYINNDKYFLGGAILLAAVFSLLGQKTIVRIRNLNNAEYVDQLVRITSVILLLSYAIMQITNGRTPESLARKDIQQWARTNTPVGSVFWAPGFNGWRSFSERRRVDDTTRENYAYIYAIEEAKEYRKKLLKFYGLIEGENTIPLDTNLLEKERYLAKQFTGEKYRQLGNEFNVTHVVLEKNNNSLLDFPIVYQNSYFIVYKIDG
jgi:hypothetical protein